MTTKLINMNAGCNTDCIYCKRNQFIKENNTKQMTFEEFDKIINSDKEITSESQIMFSGGGEPTCHNELPIFMFNAKKKGFKNIALETNGIKLSEKKYLKLLINSGLTSLVISIPSLNEGTYEKITDSKGSFALIKEALGNITKRKIPISDILITIVKYNYKELVPLIKGLRKYANRFSVFHARPNYTTAFEKEIIVKYSELQKYLYDAFEYCDKNKIEISNGTGAGAIPLCCMDKYLNKSSYYFQSRQNLQPERHHETLTYIKACESCKLKENCPGIPKNYITLFGDKEFHPLFKKYPVIMKEKVVVFLKGCNNRCVFCYQRNTDPLLYWDFEKFKKEIEKTIKEGRSKDIYVEFTGEECTVHKDFIKMIDFLNERNIIFSISTNARKLSDKKFLEHLKPGLFSVYASIHSSNEKTHDIITTIKGSYAETKQGIKNCVENKIPIMVNCVINLLNYKELISIAKMLVEELKVDEVRFSLMRDFFDLDRMKQLMPNLKDLKKELGSAIDYLYENNATFSFEKLPLCIIKRNESFEKQWYYWYEEQIVFFKPDFCNSCSKYNECTGITNIYYKKYGVLGLEPFN